MTLHTKPNSSGRPICVLALPLLLLWLLLCLTIDESVGGKTTTIVRHTDTADPDLDGFWTNRTTWNARWVKYWRAKRIYEPVWKKVWTPTILTEWVPLPNAPAPDAWEEQKQDKL
ncbi:GH20367 [Drosophila grimshawi]|uniref:GH20367 n=2 Tax=Drosophila grimshawi TaxID=7222 RepID=B4J4B9_DROGR|nr:GH20367 [Drosophila grimshawi]